MLKGELGLVSLPNVLQLFCNEKKTGSMVIYDDEDQLIGEIFFKDGQIIAARKGKLKGQKALYNLLLLKKGTFSFEQNVNLPKPEIETSCEFLLLEAARYEDEIQNYLKKIKQNLGEQIERIEESDDAQEILSLLSEIGKVLEAGQLEYVWSKEGCKHLFIKLHNSVFKLRLNLHIDLKKVYQQLQYILREER